MDKVIREHIEVIKDEDKKETINITDQSNSLEIDNIIKKLDHIFPDSVVNNPNYLKIFYNISTYAYFLTMNTSEECIGMLAMYANDQQSKEAYISLIGIENEYQGYHLGEILLELAIIYAKKVGMSSIKLEVNSKNEKAIKFYKKNGFNFWKKASEKTEYLLKKI